jgi:hypothetical protein
VDTQRLSTASKMAVLGVVAENLRELGRARSILWARTSISLDIANIELCAGNLLDPIAVSFKSFHGIKSAIKVRIEIL